MSFLEFKDPQVSIGYQGSVRQRMGELRPLANQQVLSERGIQPIFIILGRQAQKKGQHIDSLNGLYGAKGRWR
jgi:hypothetical protein